MLRPKYESDYNSAVWVCFDGEAVSWHSLTVKVRSHLSKYFPSNAPLLPNIFHAGIQSNATVGGYAPHREALSISFAYATAL